MEVVLREHLFAVTVSMLTRVQCWCGEHGPMDCENTPVCPGPNCGHTRCDTCRVECLKRRKPWPIGCEQNSYPSRSLVGSVQCTCGQSMVMTEIILASQIVTFNILDIFTSVKVPNMASNLNTNHIREWGLGIRTLRALPNLLKPGRYQGNIATSRATEIKRTKADLHLITPQRMGPLTNVSR